MTSLRQCLHVVLAATCLSALAVACGTTASPSARCAPDYRVSDWNALARDVHAARQRWLATRPDSYRFTYQPITWAPLPTVRVEVRGDLVTAVQRADDGAVLSLEEHPYYSTVDELLASIEQTVRTQQHHAGCVMLRVTYDAQYGHPASYSYANLELNLADAVGGYAVSALEVLP